MANTLMEEVKPEEAKSKFPPGIDDPSTHPDLHLIPNFPVEKKPGDERVVNIEFGEEKVPITIGAAKLSMTWRNMIDDSTVEDTLPMGGNAPYVPKHVLERCIRWMEYYYTNTPKIIKPPLRHVDVLNLDEDDKKSETLPDADMEILRVTEEDRGELIQMLLLSNYLDIPRLVANSCKVLVLIGIRSKTPMEIHEFMKLSKKDEDWKQKYPYYGHI